MAKNFKPRDPPVKVGDQREVTIESVGEKGDGVAKIEGYTVFVPNTRKGDQVKVKITKALPKFAFAELVS